jgi:hypothetical protein
MISNSLQEHAFQLSAGNISYVGDTSLSVPPFPSKIKITIRGASKVNTALNKPLNCSRRLRNAQVNDDVVTQASSSIVRVRDVTGKSVIR